MQDKRQDAAFAEVFHLDGRVDAVTHLEGDLGTVGAAGDDDMTSVGAERAILGADGVRLGAVEAVTVGAKWSGEESRKDFLEAIADAGFDENLLKDVQKLTALQDCDVFDVILDLAYDVRPVTRAMRVERLA